MAKEEFEGWRKWLEPAYLLWQPGGDGYVRPPYMTRAEDNDELTPDQEYEIMAEQVNKSDGFDINFDSFLCVFNYHPVMLDYDQFIDEPGTTDKDLLAKLAKGSLEDHNKEYGTAYKFVKIVRGNYHWSSAIMFLITFQVEDPYDGLIKNFQARIRYAEDIMLEYIFCRPEPNQQVKCVGKSKTDVQKEAEKDAEKEAEKHVEKDAAKDAKKDAEKPRLE